jgi:hypothetical protein
MRKSFQLLFIGLLISTTAFCQVHQEILANWSNPSYHTIEKEYDKDDAVIIFNRTYQTYSSVTQDKIRSVIPIKSWHRKIKINTLNGLENFVAIYIPLVEDIMEEIIIVDIKGRTIKKNGEVHEIKSDFIKETTLPANTPFLFGHKGKVKQFVFQNVEIGDQIEYYYTVTYRYGYLAERFTPQGTLVAQSFYPTLENKYSFYTDKDISLYSFYSNTKNVFEKKEFSKGQTLYELTLKKPPLNKEELFDNDNYTEGIIEYCLYFNNSPIHDTWESLFKNQKSRIRKTETISTHKSIDEIAAIAQQGKTINEKVRLALEHINEPLEKDTLKLKNALKISNRADYYEAQQYVLMFKKMGVVARIVFLKDKRDGAFNPDNISFVFKDLMVEYIAEDGRPHYIALLKPHSYIDDIPYYFQGTKALRIDPTTDKIDFVNIPSFPERNQLTTQYKISILPSQKNRSTVKVLKQVHQSGAFEQAIRYDFIQELKDSTSQVFSNYEKNRLKKSFNTPKIKSLFPIRSKNNQLQWETNYEYTIPSGLSSNSMVLCINDLLEHSYKLNIADRTDRTKNAYLSHPYTKKYTLSIRIPNEYQIVENNFLRNQVKTSIGFFESKYKITAPNTIEIEYEIAFFKDVITVEEWPLVVEIFDSAYALQTQKIYLQKK